MSEKGTVPAEKTHSPLPILTCITARSGEAPALFHTPTSSFSLVL